MDWGMNPDSVEAIATAVGLLLVVTGGGIALVSLRNDRKTRNSQLLMTILKELNDLFIPGDVYGRLKELAGEDQQVDWSATLNPDLVVLNKVLKTYNAIGLLIDEGMVGHSVAVRQIWPALLQRYEDLKPIIDPQLGENDGLHSLVRSCHNFATSNGPWPRQRTT